MSLSPVVDTAYRLAAADLGGRPRQVLVRQVGLQGLENLGPLLFFEGVARPLALDHDQRVQMSRITRSYMVADWVGAALILLPVREQGRETIRLFDIDERGARSELPRESWRSETVARGPLWIRAMLLLLLLALAFYLVVTMERAPDLSFLTDLFAR